ncbi:iron complex transport system substrate-binding protein [Lachnospiraceae bacterium XBB1006]|nr:iron complex transport system substrate-binding protein [Lachnospiraceae bacterium XBB1006]
MKKRGWLAILFGLIILALAGCQTKKEEKLADGKYKATLTMEGGTGKASIASPVDVTVKDGKLTATLVWSSTHYDYMIVNDKKYVNEAKSGENSTFTVPIEGLPCEMKVVADTTAMSVPHEIEYTLKLELAEADFSQMEKTGELELAYADQFSVDYYDNYRMVHIENSGDFFVVPKGEQVPKNLPKNTVVLQQPLDKTYLVSTSVMDPIQKIGALANIRLTGTKAQDWYIPEAKAAMEAGKILFAGKYSQPDYERILEEGCNLVLENTMILHNPQTKEKLEKLGIPVLVERSSYEAHPLGRLEWMKFFGVLYGKEKEAARLYQQEVKKLEPILTKEKTGKKVAFFYFSADKSVNVRKPGDYISRMIELAGGTYCITDIPDMEDNALSTASMQMEDFYVMAKDADVLIYNSTIVGEVTSCAELIKQNELLKEFKAVKQGQVYCTGQNFFQQTTGTCSFIEDLDKVLHEEKGSMVYLKKMR